MTMMHLDYPSQKGWMKWEELGCMARALGFPSEVYYNCIPEEFLQEHSEGDGLSIQNMLKLMKEGKVFNKAVDKTCNIHTDEWNLCVIEKALHLLDNRVVTFEELYRIRMAYQVYEQADTRGLHLTEKMLLRTLKMCNRQISPLKMMHRIKHMRDNFEEENRIQLHEFLDLILWCDAAEEVVLAAPALDSSKTADALYRLEDFESLLQHHDETLATRLNDAYRSEELTFAKEQHGSRKMPKDVPPVDPEVRKKQVVYHKKKYSFMQNELKLSARSCHQAKAGKVRERPITAPDLLLYHEGEASMRVSTLDPRPATVYETIGHLIRPLTRQSTLCLSDVRELVPRPALPRYARPCTPAAVTSADQRRHQSDMQALSFDIATLEHKYEQILMEELDEMMPGYREKKAKKPKINKVEVVEEKVQREPRPSPQTLQQLAYHEREPPRPAHAQACDARFRGWLRARTLRGQHSILVAPSFEQSDVGRQLSRLRETAMRQGKLDNYVTRLTTVVLPEKPVSRAPRPSLAPLPAESSTLSGPLRESTRLPAKQLPSPRRPLPLESSQQARIQAAERAGIQGGAPRGGEKSFNMSRNEPPDTGRGDGTGRQELRLERLVSRVDGLVSRDFHSHLRGMQREITVG